MYFDIDRTPINKNAVRVIQEGIHFEPDIKYSNKIWFKIKPNTVPFTGNLKDNLTGYKYGRMTVIGRYSSQKIRIPTKKMKKIGLKKKVTAKGLWLVQCSCSAYELRHSKSIKNSNNQDDRCQRCRSIQYKKSTYQYWQEQIKVNQYGGDHEHTNQ